MYFIIIKIFYKFCLLNTYFIIGTIYLITILQIASFLPNDNLILIEWNMYNIANILILILYRLQFLGWQEWPLYIGSWQCVIHLEHATVLLCANSARRGCCIYKVHAFVGTRPSEICMHPDDERGWWLCAVGRGGERAALIKSLWS